MDRTYRFRTSLVVALILVVAAVFTIRLFGLQLTEDETDTYSSADTVTYTVHLHVENGGIAFVNSPCPDHLCEGFGRLKAQGDWAACMPARASLTIQ